MPLCCMLMRKHNKCCANDTCHNSTTNIHGRRCACSPPSSLTNIPARKVIVSAYRKVLSSTTNEHSTTEQSVNFWIRVGLKSETVVTLDVHLCSVLNARRHDKRCTNDSCYHTTRNVYGSRCVVFPRIKYAFACMQRLRIQ